VQTLKRALRKHVEQTADVYTWDEGVPWIALGYRCSPQANTKLSPYQLLYARQPTVPPAIVQRMATPVDFDDPHLAAESLLQRAAWVRAMCVEAGDNLLIAQHRDTKRYAMVRQGSYKPSLVEFQPGQFVYVQRADKSNSLQIKARPNVLRVVDIRPGGTVTLQGKCGSTTEQHVSNLAPCHLPGIDPTIDPTVARPPADHPCEVCRLPNRPASMLLCDNCNSGWHINCLNPPLKKVPQGAWICPYCTASGVSMAEAAARQAANEAAQLAARPDVAPQFTIHRRRMLAKAQQLHGRYIVYPFPGPGRTKVPTWGRVEYLGDQCYPRCLRAHYRDGTKFDVTLRGVRPYLQAADVTPPSSANIDLPTVSAFSVAQAPLVGGHTEPSVAPAVDQWQLAALGQVVPLHLFKVAITPLPVQGLHTALSHQCQATSLQNICSAAALAAGSAVRLSCPLFWHSVAQQHGPQAAVVACLPPNMLDAVLPAVTCCSLGLLALVPADFVSNAPDSRLLWLAELQHSQHVQFVVGCKAQGQQAESVAWLCVFPSARVRRQILPASEFGGCRTTVVLS